MKIQLQKGKSADEVSWTHSEHIFHGEAVDDRGAEAMLHAKKWSDNLHIIRYFPDTHGVEIGGRIISSDNFTEAFSSFVDKRISLEATTLGFVELLLCYRALYELKIANVDTIYIEPKSYRSTPSGKLLERRDFELSDAVPGFQAVPGNGVLLNDRRPDKGVFLLGYEDSRLRRAFEDLQMIKPRLSSITFGVPAFNPGWEMDAIANNITVIVEQGIRGGVYFCGAENPLAVVELLEELYGGLRAPERLFVAPIGTKPHGIGAALFASKHPDVGIIYDHPKRKDNRTSYTKSWHLFQIRDFLDVM